MATPPDPHYTHVGAGTLQVIGAIVGFMGVVAGMIIYFNAPEQTTGIAAMVKLNDNMRLMMQISGIAVGVGSLINGLLIYIVGGMAMSVLDIWKAKFHQSTAAESVPEGASTSSGVSPGPSGLVD